MLNSFQHLIKSTGYETLNQVQGDTKRFGQHARNGGKSKKVKLPIRIFYDTKLPNISIEKIHDNKDWTPQCGKC